jgi:acyl-CoA dehydrogenase
MSLSNSRNSPEYQELLKNIYDIGKNVIAANAEDVDKQARFPKESINALKELKLLSAYVPKEFGGMGLDLHQLSKICEVLGHYCGSTAMIYAMHQIQVACITHHYDGSEFWKSYLERLCNEERLIASATTEVGIGGDLLSSICAVEVDGEEFKLEKKAPVISYGLEADDILVTARRTTESPKSDQVQVMVHKEDCELEPISGWDTLGFRGTCSRGFIIKATGKKEQVFPAPFAEILSQSMHPFSHVVWAALWSGIAADAVNKARKFIKRQAANNIEAPPISAIRLGEVDAILQTMRSNKEKLEDEYVQMLNENDSNAFSNFGFGIRVNNLKMMSANLIVDIVGKSMMICGIASYRNDHALTLGRHLRDAYGAALMVNNDRIMLHNSTLLLMHKESP